MRSEMLVASLEATSGSVIANAERMRPSNSGRNHMSCCSGVPNWVSTSMLPVSGAEQLQASLAMLLRPMISASGAYSALVSPGPHSLWGWNRFHRPRVCASAFSSSMIAGWWCGLPLSTMAWWYTDSFG
jgi:hypothetical protein